MLAKAPGPVIGRWPYFLPSARAAGASGVPVDVRSSGGGRSSGRAQWQGRRAVVAVTAELHERGRDRHSGEQSQHEHGREHRAPPFHQGSPCSRPERRRQGDHRVRDRGFPPGSAARGRACPSGARAARRRPTPSGPRRRRGPPMPRRRASSSRRRRARAAARGWRRSPCGVMPRTSAERPGMSRSESASSAASVSLVVDRLEHAVDDGAAVVHRAVEQERAYTRPSSAVTEKATVAGARLRRAGRIRRRSSRAAAGARHRGRIPWARSPGAPSTDGREVPDELLVEQLVERVAVGGLPLGESADAARGGGVRSWSCCSVCEHTGWWSRPVLAASASPVESRWEVVDGPLLVIDRDDARPAHRRAARRGAAPRHPRRRLRAGRPRAVDAGAGVRARRRPQRGRRRVRAARGRGLPRDAPGRADPRGAARARSTAERRASRDPRPRANPGPGLGDAVRGPRAARRGPDRAPRIDLLPGRPSTRGSTRAHGVRRGGTPPARGARRVAAAVRRRAPARRDRRPPAPGARRGVLGRRRGRHGGHQRGGRAPGIRPCGCSSAGTPRSPSSIPGTRRRGARSSGAVRSDGARARGRRRHRGGGTATDPPAPARRHGHAEPPVPARRAAAGGRPPRAARVGARRRRRRHRGRLRQRVPPPRRAAARARLARRRRTRGARRQLLEGAHAVASTRVPRAAADPRCDPRSRPCATTSRARCRASPGGRGRAARDRRGAAAHRGCPTRLRAPAPARARRARGDRPARRCRASTAACTRSSGCRRTTRGPRRRARRSGGAFLVAPFLCGFPGEGPAGIVLGYASPTDARLADALARVRAGSNASSRRPSTDPVVPAAAASRSAGQHRKR